MPDSENSSSESESSNNDTGESQESELSEAEQLAKFLAPPEADADKKKADDDGTTEKPGESQKKGKPKTINDVAERLGVDVNDLFEIEFPLGNQAGGDGESRTLSQLKDMAVEHGQLDVDRLKFEENKSKKETEFVRANAELQELVNMLPKAAITPEFLQVIANKRAAILTKESALTLTHIPEWSDSDKETTDRTAMREHLSAYGFSEGYLESVTDHKTLKYIRDNMQRQQRIEAVLAKIKQVKKPGHKPSAKPGSSKKTPAHGSKVRSVDQQTAAVAELLKTG